jgi:FeS assembly SUF system protein
MKDLPVVRPSSPAPPEATPAALQTDRMVRDGERSAALTPQIVKALSGVYDPEIPVNIYDLGLIYDIIVDASSAVGIRMTLTAPACPAAQVLPEQVRAAAAAVPGVAGVAVDVVWDPPWDRDRMSDAAKLQLGMF